MTSMEKAELLKTTITKLYSKEGRSISYISRLLEINRRTLGAKISEWDLPVAPYVHRLTPSNQKFANANRTYIKSRLDRNIPIAQIAQELGVSRDYLQRTILPNDPVLSNAHTDYINRYHTNAATRIDRIKEESSLKYDFEDLPGEEWRPILGYEKYMVSNMGRVKAYAERYDSFYLLNLIVNPVNGRVYVNLHREKKGKNLMLARVVAFAFVDGHSDEKNTVNHKDGNVLNNKAENLEWMTQGQNNEHSYRELNRQKNAGKRYQFKKIVYLDKYEFKTVAALARFLKKSETQTRRYLDAPQDHDIKLVG